MADTRPAKRHQGPRAWSSSDQAKREAGAQLLEELLRLYANCRLSATTFCRLCKLADEAGCQGAAFGDYAFSGRAAQRHLDAVLPRSGELFLQPTPCTKKRSTSREMTTVPMRVLWSSIEQELKEDPKNSAVLDDPSRTEKNVLDLPVYLSNDTVRTSVKKPVPMSLYLDGVQFISQASGRSESVLGLWAENIISGRRHYICGIKQADICSCGCRGWCTLQPVLQRIEWFFYGLQSGAVPKSHPDGSPYEPADPTAMRAGARLSRPAVLVWIKGDWAEHVHSLGLSSWSAVHAPCQFCKWGRDDISEKGHLMCKRFPEWPLRVGGDYEAACRACEVDVNIRSKPDAVQLALALKWTKNKNHIGGLVCYRAVKINGTEVRPGDRLEPSASLGDIGALTDIPCPNKVVLWRPNFRSGKMCDPLSRRCPIFSTRLGTSPSANLAVDGLHTLALGVTMKYVSAGLWRLLLNDVYGVNASTDIVLDTSIPLLKKELGNFQKNPANSTDASRHIGDLTLKMLGKRKKCTVQDCIFSVMCNALPERSRVDGYNVSDSQKIPSGPVTILNGHGTSLSKLPNLSRLPFIR